MQKRYTREEKRHAVDLYRSGRFVTDIAREMECSEASVFYWTRNADALRPRSESVRLSAKKRNAAERERTRYLYHKRGLTTAQVSRIMGYSADTIGKWLEGTARGYEIRQRTRYDLRLPQGRRHMFRIQEACRLRSEGVLRVDVARRMGVSETTISNWWKSEHNPYRPERPGPAPHRADETAVPPGLRVLILPSRINDMLEAECAGNAGERRAA